MTLAKALEAFDSERLNNVSVEIKKEWVSQLDSKIYAEILKERGRSGFKGYGVLTPPDVTLLAPEEYGEIYSLYMNMKLDYMNGEIGRFNNSALLFNRMYKEMYDSINRKNAVTRKTKIKVGDLIV